MSIKEIAQRDFDFFKTNCKENAVFKFLLNPSAPFSSDHCLKILDCVSYRAFNFSDNNSDIIPSAFVFNSGGV